MFLMTLSSPWPGDEVRELEEQVTTEYEAWVEFLATPEWEEEPGILQKGPRLDTAPSQGLPASRPASEPPDSE